MLSGLRLGPSPRIRKIQSETFPELAILQEALSELFLIPTEARFEFSWSAGRQYYVLTLSHSLAVSTADWKLYRRSGENTKLVWEHQTNDVSLLHNLVLFETGQKNRIAHADCMLSTVHGPLMTPRPKVAPYVPCPTIVAQQRSNSSPARIVECIDLSEARKLREELSVKDLGILSTPAFLFLLEQDLREAIDRGSNLSLIICKVEPIQPLKSTLPHSSPHRAALLKCFQQIKCLHRRNDVLAEYTGNRFAILLPETDAKGANFFAGKIERALLNNGFIQGGANYPIFKMTFGIAALENQQMSKASLLQAAENALASTEEMDKNPALCDGPQFFRPPIDERSCSIETDLRRQNTSANDFTDSMHSIIAQFVDSTYGVYTYPAFLMSLEREYYRAARHRQSVFILQLKLQNRATNTDCTAELSSLTAQLIERIARSSQDADVLSLKNDGTLNLLRPGASAGCLRNLASGLASSWARTTTSGDPTMLLVRVCSIDTSQAQPGIMRLIATG